MNELKGKLLPVGVTPGAVLYNKAQNLTEEQRARARANIGVTGEGAVLPPSESIRAIVKQLFKEADVTNELFNKFVEWLFAGDEVTENFYDELITNLFAAEEITKKFFNEFIENFYSNEEITNKFFEEFITEIFEGDQITEEFITNLTDVLKKDEYFISQITQRVVQELPIASAETLGGIKIGAGLAIDENGVLSVVGGGSDLPDGDGVSY